MTSAPATLVSLAVVPGISVVGTPTADRIDLRVRGPLAPGVLIGILSARPPGWQGYFTVTAPLAVFQMALITGPAGLPDGEFSATVEAAP